MIIHTQLTWLYVLVLLPAIIRLKAKSLCVWNIQALLLWWGCLSWLALNSNMSHWGVDKFEYLKKKKLLWQVVLHIYSSAKTLWFLCFKSLLIVRADECMGVMLRRWNLPSWLPTLHSLWSWTQRNLAGIALRSLCWMEAKVRGQNTEVKPFGMASSCFGQ